MSKAKYLENERFCRAEAMRPGAHVEAWIRMAEQWAMMASALDKRGGPFRQSEELPPTLHQQQAQPEHPNDAK
jgi:hypothetical protein